MRMTRCLTPALLGLALAAGSALGQGNPFYDQPSAAVRAELNDWGKRYTYLLDSGSPAGDAKTFAFSKAGMNSPLFNPVMGAARTALASTKENLDVTGCVTESNLSAANVACNATAARARNYLMGSIVGAHTVDEPNLASGLEASVNEAVNNGYNVTSEVVNQQFVSYNLPLYAVAKDNTVQAQYAAIDPMDVSWIGLVANQAAATAAQSGQISHPTALLTGTADAGLTMQTAVASSLNGIQVAGRPVMVYVTHALFGTCGDLPIVVVTYDRGFLLVDSVNGQTIGPFEPGTGIFAQKLLGQHLDAYDGSSPIQMVVAIGNDGCVDSGAVAATWHEVPWWRPWWPWGTPRPAVPGLPKAPPPTPAPTPPGPGYPAPPPANPSAPGWAAWSCSAAGAMCCCTETSQQLVAGPPQVLYWVITYYTCPGLGSCPPAGFPTGCTIQSQWYWW